MWTFNLRLYARGTKYQSDGAEKDTWKDMLNNIRLVYYSNIKY